MISEPKPLTEAEWRNVFAYNADIALDYIRGRGLIAEEPVDPLLAEARRIVAEIGLSLAGPGDGAARCNMAASGDHDGFYENKIALAALRRGMELQREKLTREMVREAYHTAHVGAAEAPPFTDRLHAALLERLS